MIVVTTVEDLRHALGERAGRSVGFVPTMGALHRGHLELLHRARAENEVVVLSVFVNPAQFNDPADLAAYPRTDEADRSHAELAGVDIYFAPTPDVVYPAGFTATVALSGPIVETFEGARRGAGHFHGVPPVVTKLFGMVRPDRAYFGQKDAQQLRVVRAMVADLNIDVRIVAVPTVREPDGLALSSRNVRLSAADRATALGLSRALDAGEAAHDRGVTAAEIVLAAELVLTRFGIHPEYLAVVDNADFRQLHEVPPSGSVLIVAAEVGGIRLIDNAVLA